MEQRRWQGAVPARRAPRPRHRLRLQRQRPAPRLVRQRSGRCVSGTRPTARAVAVIGAHAAAVRGVAFSPNNNAVYSAGADGSLEVLGAAAGRLETAGRAARRRRDAPWLCRRTAIRSSPPAPTRACAWRTRRTASWSAISRGRRRPSSRVALSPNGALIAAGTADRRLLVWQAKDGQVLANVAQPGDGPRLQPRLEPASDRRRRRRAQAVGHAAGAGADADASRRRACGGRSAPTASGCSPAAPTRSSAPGTWPIHSSRSASSPATPPPSTPSPSAPMASSSPRPATMRRSASGTRPTASRPPSSAPTPAR